MEANSRNFRQVQSIQLSDCITSIASCSQYFAAGCLDDSLYMWQTGFTTFNKQPVFNKIGNSMGIINMQFNNTHTSLAVSCLDSTIKLWDVDTRQSSTLDCAVMENWKVQYIDSQIATCGDMGHINFYDVVSKEKIKSINTGETFLTALSKTNDEQFMASANTNGTVYIIKMSNKKTVSLKAHYKQVRSLSFTEDATKLLSCSDDFTVKVTDILNEKVITSLQGHKGPVTCVCSHPTNSKILFSCSFDQSLHCWDLRQKSSIGFIMTGRAIWNCKVLDKHILAGGDSGILSIYSIQ